MNKQIGNNQENKEEQRFQKNIKKTVKEVIVVEGRDDTAAIKRAIDADTIETHGFGIRRTTWELIENASRERGIIIFTDPDYSGNEIRRRLKERFPEAKEAVSRKSRCRKGRRCRHRKCGAVCYHSSARKCAFDADGKARGVYGTGSYDKRPCGGRLKTTP